MLADLTEGVQTEAELLRRYQGIIADPNSPPGVVELATANRTRILKERQAETMLANIGETSVEAAMKAIPRKLAQAQESGDIQALEFELANAAKVQTLAVERHVEVLPEVQAMVEVAAQQQQRLEGQEREVLAALIAELGPYAGDGDELQRWYYEHAQYREVSGRLGGGDERVSEKVAQLAVEAADGLQGEIDEEEERRAQVRARLEFELLCTEVG